MPWCVRRRLSHSQFHCPEVAEVIFEVAVRPLDPELETVLKYARGQVNVDRLLQEMIDSQSHFLTQRCSTHWKKQTSSTWPSCLVPEAVCEAMLSRTNASAQLLREALDSLAKLRQTSSLPLMLKLVQERDAAGNADSLAGLGQLLAEQPAAD